MSQQYPPDNNGQPWNDPQQPSQPWNNPPSQPWNNPQQPPYQQYPDNSNQQWNNPQQPQPPYQQYPQQPYYPQQPPMYQQPPKRRAKWPWFVGGGCLVLLLLSCGILVVLGKFTATATQSGLSNLAATVQVAAQASVTPASVSAHHKINEVVNVDNTWEITVTKVSTNQGGSALVTPQAGNTLLQVEVTMKNISTKQQTASSLIQYSLRDASGQKYTEDLLTGKVGPEGAVAAGNPLKGTITYEVSKNTKSFVLEFTANFTGELASWDLTA